MNLPTVIGALIVFALFAAIVGRGIYNKKHRKSGCGCGCDHCPGSGICRPK